MPGVLIVEALAQVGAVAILSEEEIRAGRHISGQSTTQNSRKR